MKKHLVILPIVLCLLISCQDKQIKAELEELKTQNELEMQNKNLAQSMFEAWSSGDLETFKGFLSEDYIFHYPSSNTTTRSGEELQTARMLREGFPDLSFSMEDIYAEGDKVIFRFIQHGTHSSDYAGIPATGNKINCSGILISRFKNSKVAEQWEEFDMLGLMQQLGMELQMRE